MDTVPPYPQSEPSNNIFSLTDKVLSERLEFIDEIGFGNWGSVWLCRPKPTTASDGRSRPGPKFAAKVVHRSKTSTTAARVRSLWNEMKIIKSLKSEPHPSIILFHSFIITPSYALITMTYLPTLVPVEVEESKAREWFRFLLSGVEFLHARGIVHNDIKPANILVSHKNIPVLVDFGFAEKYDISSDTAFHSNLSYGTPEYLSPERARGLPHDTRKSDVWSLGVTFFEILIGRTPFEKSDGEEFSTKEDLEKYWERTLRGKWVGTWELSQGMERLLQRMMSPNADLRCTAKQAMAHAYWQGLKRDASHKRASSCTSTTSSIAFEKDMDRLLIMTPSAWKGLKDRNSDEKVVVETKNLPSPPRLDIFNDSPEDPSVSRVRSGLSRSRSQPRVGIAKALHGRKRAQAPPIAELSPIKASPIRSPMTSHIRMHSPNSSISASVKAKENISNFNKLAATMVDPKKNARTPFGTLKTNGTNTRPASMVSKKPSGQSHGAKAIKVLGAANMNGANTSYTVDNSLASISMADKSKESANVRDRVQDWEREKERLREMERLEDLEKQRVGLHNRQKKEKKRRKGKENEKNDDDEPQQGKELVPVRASIEQADHPAEKRLIDRKSASHLHIKIPNARSFEQTNVTNSGDTDPSRDKRKTNNDRDSDKENIFSSATSPVLPMFRTGPPLTQAFNIYMDTPSSAAFRHVKGTKGSFKHSIKASIDKTIEFCKSASITSGRATPARGFSFDVMRPSTKDNKGNDAKDGKEAWEFEEVTSSEIVSPLPVIKNAAESEKIAADARMDRMTIWMRNVEKLVDEAKENFASASVNKDLPLPPLPPPLPRTQPHSRTSRLPRRVLAASQIFQSDENGNITPMIDQSIVSNTNSSFLTAHDVVPSTPAPAVARKTQALPDTAHTPIEEGTSQVQIPDIQTPSRQRRRATVSIGSPMQNHPEGLHAKASPSQRKEKSKSQSNLLDMHIVPIADLEAELNKTPSPEPVPRLCEVIDPNLFIAPPLGSSRDDLLDSHDISEVRQSSLDELTSSPYHVEPYPQRQSLNLPALDTPARHRLEGVYDRFLMATSGVKRVGKGYQSDHLGPVSNNKGHGINLGLAQHKARAFYSTRRPMPPPVSSDDLQRMALSVDELGNWSNVEEIQEYPKDPDVGFVRKAIKLMVPKATSSKRLSRIS